MVKFNYIKAERIFMSKQAKRNVFVIQDTNKNNIVMINDIKFRHWQDEEAG